MISQGKECAGELEVKMKEHGARVPKCNSGMIGFRSSMPCPIIKGALSPRNTAHPYGCTSPDMVYLVFRAMYLGVRLAPMGPARIRRGLG
jgi:hypothetical protein